MVQKLYPYTKKIIFSLSFLLFLNHAVLSSADDGLIRIKSAHNVTQTADRLETLLQDKGMTLFARINHAKGAAAVGQALRPTELLIFGNPKVGTPLMQCNQVAGIDLPQKALIWEDEEGQTWLGYNHPRYLDRRHGLVECKAVLEKVGTALAAFAKGVTQP